MALSKSAPLSSFNRFSGAATLTGNALLTTFGVDSSFGNRKKDGLPDSTLSLPLRYTTAGLLFIGGKVEGEGFGCFALSC